jgi:signal transduction histidine kinase
MDTVPQQLLARALNALPHAVVITDLTGEILASNSAAGEILSATGRLPTTEEAHDHSVVNWQTQLAAAQETDEGVVTRSVYLPIGEGRRKLVDLFLRRLGEWHGRQTALIVVEDVAERAAMERRLVTSERLAALGRLAGRIAHELNNPLDGILRYIGLAQRVGGEESHPYLDSARNGLQRMAGIIRDMLGHTSVGTGTSDRAPVDKLLDEAITVMQPPAQAAGVSVVCDIDESASVAASTALFQVFCNVIKNALDAMPNGGMLGIALRRRDGDCVLEFADTGEGIAQADVDRIFEPFYTTKSGQGAGLGLSVCRGILGRMGGTIAATNRPDAGAVITVRIPPVESAPPADNKPAG